MALKQTIQLKGYRYNGANYITYNQLQVHDKYGVCYVNRTIENMRDNRWLLLINYKGEVFVQQKQIMKTETVKTETNDLQRITYFKYFNRFDKLDKDAYKTQYVENENKTIKIQFSWWKSAKDTLLKGKVYDDCVIAATKFDSEKRFLLLNDGEYLLIKQFRKPNKKGKIVDNLFDCIHTGKYEIFEECDETQYLKYIADDKEYYVFEPNVKIHIPIEDSSDVHCYSFIENESCVGCPHEDRVNILKSAYGERSDSNPNGITDKTILKIVPRATKVDGNDTDETVVTFENSAKTRSNSLHRDTNPVAQQNESVDSK